MIGRVFLGTAAMTLASQLSGARQAVSEGSLGELDVTRPAPSLAASVLLREFRHGVIPELERSLRVIANATPVQTLSGTQLTAAWNGIRLGPDEVWVDIGSGNGDTLGRMAKKHPGRFLGIDKENSGALFFELKRGARFLNELPSNVRYLVLSYNRPEQCQVRHERLQPVSVRTWTDRPSDADMVMDATVDTVGAASAAVVSLFFPYSESRKRHLLGRMIKGPMPEIIDYQFKTAIRLLRPGGMGVAVLEATSTADQMRVLDRALFALRARPELRWIGYTPQGFDVDLLGVAPYAPQDEQGRAVDTHALHQGRAVFFAKKD